MSILNQITERYQIVEVFPSGFSDIVCHTRLKQDAINMAKFYSADDKCLVTVIDRLARYGTTDSWDYREGRLVASRVKLIPQDKIVF